MCEVGRQTEHGPLLALAQSVQTQPTATVGGDGTAAQGHSAQNLGEGAKEMARERGEAKPRGQGQDWLGKQNSLQLQRVEELMGSLSHGGADAHGGISFAPWG